MLELVDSDYMAAALDARWQPELAGCNDLVLIDPAGPKGLAVMNTLSETTGAPLSGVRVLSPAGLREVAVIDELRLPPAPGLPRSVRHLQTRRLQPETPSPALDRLWRQTRVGVMLLDHLSPELASYWLLSLSTLVRRLGDDGPNWAIFGPGPRLPPEPAPGGPAWMHKLHFQPPLSPPGRSASPSAVWNAIFQAWSALR